MHTVTRCHDLLLLLLGMFFMDDEEDDGLVDFDGAQAYLSCLLLLQHSPWL